MKAFARSPTDLENGQNHVLRDVRDPLGILAIGGKSCSELCKIYLTVAGLQDFCHQPLTNLITM